jgi:phosphotransferase system  glucose/maltose/N-acetylglucosamine-specific IIC component
LGGGGLDIKYLLFINVYSLKSLYTPNYYLFFASVFCFCFSFCFGVGVKRQQQKTKTRQKQKQKQKETRKQRKTSKQLIVWCVEVSQ